MRHAAVAVLLAALGCSAALSSGCGLTGSGADGPAISYQGYGGTAIVSADGRTITVGEFGESCFVKARAVAWESATRVALFLRLSTLRTSSPCPNAAASRVPAQTIRLHEPLARRKLVDGGTGRATAWISAKLVLRPSTLPPGYGLFELIPAVNLARAQAPGPAGCTQFYRSQNQAAELEIIQTAGPSLQPRLGSADRTSIRVRGHPGRASRNLITWREDGLTQYILMGVQNPQNSPQLLTTSQLIAIAQSAPQPR